MTELRMAVCDDLEEERVQLARMVRSYAQRRGLSMELRLFASGNELLDAARRSDFCHVLFLDIFMPGLSGLDAARQLRAAGCMASIVFATTSQDYGVMSFDVQAADYLVKPFQQEDVDRTLDWCLEHMPESLRVLSVYAQGEWQELPLTSISYIEVLGHQCHIHTSRRTLVVRRGLDDLESAIDSRDFLRCHRSFLVNLNCVESIQGSDFHMSDGPLVPISSANLAKVRNAFTDWVYMNAWKKKS